MKKLISIIICAVTLIVSINANAALPSSFYSIDSYYQNAVNSGNDSDIVNYGSEEISLMEQSPSNEDTMGVIGSRSIQVAEAYERLGDYDNALIYHEKYIPCAEHFNWSDGVKISTAKVNAYRSTLDLYMLTDEPVIYYGAKHEPVSGAYWGQIRETTTDRDSMTLIYYEYGFTDEINSLDSYLTEAKNSGHVVEIGLNFPYEGAQLDDILSETKFINALCDILRKHTDMTIFLRIGAEMNVWSSLPDPDKYIGAFRKITENVRAAAPKVATVWSVAHTSDNRVTMDEIYPGDEYVDWVGVSAYGNRYFQGQEENPESNINEIYFKAGVGADPSRMIKEVVEKYGDRKPIMLAENGSSTYTRGNVYIESADWAKLNMLRMYSVLMMEYPQVKMAAYFNRPMPEELQDYDFVNLDEMTNAFEEITSQPWFIQHGQSSAMSFKKMGDTIYTGDTLNIYAAPYTFKDQQPRVDYFIDDEWVNASLYLPYNTSLDLTGISDGEHVLKAVMTSNGVNKLTRTYKLIKTSGGAAYSENTVANETGNLTGASTGVTSQIQQPEASFDNASLEKNINVYLNNIPVAFDVPPMIINDRTMIPIRKIANAIGISDNNVTYNSENKKATIFNDNQTIILTIDNSTAQVNGENITLDSPATIVSDRTLVPLRFICETFGYTVDYTDDVNTLNVYLTK